jgi:hypothetical protein
VIMLYNISILSHARTVNKFKCEDVADFEFVVIDSDNDNMTDTLPQGRRSRVYELSMKERARVV